MSDAAHTRRSDNGDKIPPVLLRGMFALVLLSLLLVSYARITGRPPAAMPDDSVAVVAERLIVIEGQATSGAARVMAPDGTVIADFAPDEGGFVAGIARVLDRERGKTGADPAAPVRLVRFADGRLSLRDDATGWRAELIGFGSNNAAVFARLLEAGAGLEEKAGAARQ